jgi:hypothetical protein
MRQQRRTAAPAPAPVSRAPSKPLTSGYGLVVDGQVKADFGTKDAALKSARELKSRRPRLQVKIYDANEQRSELIELAGA